MCYERINRWEREKIALWKSKGYGVRQMARLLGRSASSVSRELARNRGDRGYRPKQAQDHARNKARRAGARKLTVELQEKIAAQLKEGWTPQIISARARQQGQEHVSHERIYLYVQQDARRGGELWRHLPRSRRKRRRRLPKADQRGRIPHARCIDQRPAEVQTRQSIGHLEGDLINGAPGTGHLLTIVERRTRLTHIARVQTKEADEVAQAIIELLKPLPAALRRSLTLDNGKEFTRHQHISASLGMDIYFAHPYHSWERGTNENTNGLIRRTHPKGSSFAAIGLEKIAQLQKRLNNRPRKVLGWRTPQEELNAQLALAP